MSDLEINNLRKGGGLRWRLTAHNMPGEYGAVLQIRSPSRNPELLQSLIATDLVTIASELEEMDNSIARRD